MRTTKRIPRWVGVEWRQSIVLDKQQQQCKPRSFFKGVVSPLVFIIIIITIMPALNANKRKHTRHTRHTRQKKIGSLLKRKAGRKRLSRKVIGGEYNPGPDGRSGGVKHTYTLLLQSFLFSIFTLFVFVWVDDVCIVIRKYTNYYYTPRR